MRRRPLQRRVPTVALENGPQGPLPDSTRRRRASRVGQARSLFEYGARQACPRLTHGATLGGMPRPYIENGRRKHRTPSLRITLLVLLILLFLSARTLSSYAIEVQWWKELGQFRTWLSMLYYGLAPVVGATLLAFLALWFTHAGALRFAQARLGEYLWYRRISMLVL